MELRSSQSNAVLINSATEGRDRFIVKKAVIIGAGPAGLTAALELTRQTDFVPVVLEASERIGGISTTIEYKGNRIDIGGHRFFSKSDEVMDWWAGILPIEAGHADEFEISYQNKTTTVSSSEIAPNPEIVDDVMLVRERQSRIYYLRKFFDYPVKINFTTIRNLGVVRILRILSSYIAARVRPIKSERSLEDFMINRFGRELYGTFFRDYTEKVWGVPCDQISAEWGAQRIKGLSITKTIMSAIRSFLPSRKASSDIRQKAVETSLIERFLYPKYGPGQMWERVASMVEEAGGEVLHRRRVERIELNEAGNRVIAVEAKDTISGKTERYEAENFISTMPIKELVESLNCERPAEVDRVAQGLS